jgi:hypothetical protein
MVRGTIGKLPLTHLTLDYLPNHLNHHYLKRFNNMPYNPLLNPGSPPVNYGEGSNPVSPFTLFSNKKIVSSSQPVRDRINQMNVVVDELEQKINDFEMQGKNNPVINNLLKYGSKT